MMQSLPTQVTEQIEALNVLNRINAKTVVEAILVLGAAWLLVRGADRLLNALGDQASRARFFFKLLSPFVRFITWAVATFIVISIFPRRAKRCSRCSLRLVSRWVWVHRTS